MRKSKLRKDNKRTKTLAIKKYKEELKELRKERNAKMDKWKSIPVEEWSEARKKYLPAEEKVTDGVEA